MLGVNALVPSLPFSFPYFFKSLNFDRYHCPTCQKSLCADCDRFLHLAKSQRSHERSVIVADTLTVDVHEGCIRAKLSILFIIIDVDRYVISSFFGI